MDNSPYQTVVQQLAAADISADLAQRAVALLARADPLSGHLALSWELAFRVCSVKSNLPVYRQLRILTEAGVLQHVIGRDTILIDFTAWRTVGEL
ncbi:MAG: hypothetical protein WC700_19990 [Gemmatimonadaceae bacterium]|jgi:hypothetical protein